MILGLTSCLPQASVPDNSTNYNSITYYVPFKGKQRIVVTEFEPKGSPGTLCVIRFEAISCFKKEPVE